MGRLPSEQLWTDFVKNDMTHDLDSQRLSDYVLGLLDSAESSQVEIHLLTCEQCRAQVERERQLTQSLRNTVAALPMPTHARMMRMMPAAPTKPVGFSFGSAWQRTATIVVATATLIAANLGLQVNGNSGSPVASPVPAHMALTATFTEQPTATATRLAFTTSTPMMTPVPVMNSR